MNDGFDAKHKGATYIQAMIINMVIIIFIDNDIKMFYVFFFASKALGNGARCYVLRIWRHLLAKCVTVDMA